ncbi:head GIN domain-containing protein [uncultured Mucilaginibacter sp.]|uniref:head GIN domain-containing protein n=1 Tax=uncultured Mucilaginibacter sp. TaxID=797541 RepID=UPI0025F0033F|nr:head GIN domain-containing protein [uncultured Mucilaginibacter sp.]
MKRLTYTIFAAILVFAVSFKSSAQSGESRQVSGFHSIASGGPFNVHVKINGTESLKISTRPDIIKLIETVVEDGTLKIKFRDHLRSGEGDTDGPIDIYVTAKSLSALVNSGSGSIRVVGAAVSGENVNIVLSGSGDIESAVKTGNLHTTISGSGTIQLRGSVNETKVVISGSGEMKGKELKTNSASVVISGSGNAYLNADKTVSAHIVGSGNVVYSGNATITDSKTVGSGSVSKED